MRNAPWTWSNMPQSRRWPSSSSQSLRSRSSCRALSSQYAAQGSSTCHARAAAAWSLALSPLRKALAAFQQDIVANGFPPAQAWRGASRGKPPEAVSKSSASAWRKLSDGQSSPAPQLDRPAPESPRPTAARRRTAAGHALLADTAARHRDRRLLADQGGVRSAARPSHAGRRGELRYPTNGARIRTAVICKQRKTLSFSRLRLHRRDSFTSALSGSCRAGPAMGPAAGERRSQRGAGGAAVAPVVQGFACALVAGVSVAADEVDQGVATEVVGHLPGLGLVDPHQRRVDAQAPLQAQVQGQLHGFHGVVAAIGVARVVGLADAGHDHRQAAPVGQRAGQGQEQQVTPWHEGVGQAVGLHGEGHVLGQRGAADLLQHVQRQHMVLTQAGSPFGKIPSQALAHLQAHLHLHAVALAIVKAQGLDPLDWVQGALAEHDSGRSRSLTRIARPPTEAVPQVLRLSRRRPAAAASLSPIATDGSWWATLCQPGGDLVARKAESPVGTNGQGSGLAFAQECQLRRGRRCAGTGNAGFSTRHLKLGQDNRPRCGAAAPFATRQFQAEPICGPCRPAHVDCSALASSTWGQAHRRCAHERQAAQGLCGSQPCRPQVEMPSCKGCTSPDWWMVRTNSPHPAPAWATRAKQGRIKSSCCRCSIHRDAHGRAAPGQDRKSCGENTWHAPDPHRSSNSASCLALMVGTTPLPWRNARGSSPTSWRKPSSVLLAAGWVSPSQPGPRPTRCASARTVQDNQAIQGPLAQALADGPASNRGLPRTQSPDAPAGKHFVGLGSHSNSS
ncbi:hypothetical protein FQR65_LT20373 [Abscondita terminalis]|nr:hypothetical protein FQR65_LT20373 [Abscondita terminalis]